MRSERIQAVEGQYGPFSMISIGLPGDHAGKTSVRIFMVQGDQKTALIDSGLYAGYEQLSQAFTELGLAKSDLDYLLLTHEHMDHVGNNAQLVEETGCKIFAHAGRADRIADNMLNAVTIVHAFPEIEPLFDLKEEYLDWMGPKAAPVNEFLKEGDMVDLGNIKLEVVELMGHSMGEIGFFHDDSKILVFADPLLPAYNPVLYLYEDPHVMRATCNKIANFIRERGVQTVLSSHDFPCDAETGIAWAIDCHGRVDAIEAAVLETIKHHAGITMGVLRDKICDQFDKVREWRALVTLKAHLVDFEKQGLIQKQGEGWWLRSNLSGKAARHTAVLGSGTMGSQIALSLALGGMTVSLWGRRAASLAAAQERIEADLAYMIEVGLVTVERDQILGRIKTGEDLAEAVSKAIFVLEAIVEDLGQKQELLAQAESYASAGTIFSSTTSALSATALQSALNRPERFAIAHYAQPGHLVRLVEVVPGKQTVEETTQFVIDLLAQCDKCPVSCPDIPGFLWVRIQHAILREFVSLVSQGLVPPEVCDTVLKEGYAVRLPAMGCFEHADLAGLDLIDSEAARAVWADLSNVTTPSETMIGELKGQGHLGMRSGRGFYDWTERDPEAFKRNRDEEIVRRMLIQAGGEVQPPQLKS